METQKWWHPRFRKCIYPRQYHDLIPSNRTFIRHPAPAFHLTPIRTVHRWPIPLAWIQHQNMISLTILRTYTVPLAVIFIRIICRNPVMATTSNRNQTQPTTSTWTIVSRVDISEARLRHLRYTLHLIWPDIIISTMLSKRLNWWHLLEESEQLYEVPPIDLRWMYKNESWCKLIIF